MVSLGEVREGLVPLFRESRGRKEICGHAPGFKDVFGKKPPRGYFTCESCPSGDLLREAEVA